MRLNAKAVSPKTGDSKVAKVVRASLIALFVSKQAAPEVTIEEVSYRDRAHTFASPPHLEFDPSPPMFIIPLSLLFFLALLYSFFPCPILSTILSTSCSAMLFGPNPVSQTLTRILITIPTRNPSPNPRRPLWGIKTPQSTKLGLLRAFLLSAMAVTQPPGLSVP